MFKNSLAGNNSSFTEPMALWTLSTSSVLSSFGFLEAPCQEEQRLLNMQPDSYGSPES